METIDNVNGIREQLPNSSGTLVMGILSIVCICCGVGLLVGLVLGILALVYAKKAKALYDENPDRYTETSVKNANAGRICGIIGLSLGGVAVLFAIVVWVLMVLGFIAAAGLHF
ncbi:MAG: hypothetical protein IKO46_05775 [Salinivirgaceae bacterium]|jgi:ABC-type nickel/cobalt efflux system permease component RcnA|nr:hypothetical protein [Salinivirgaceae bacterium]MBR6081979.1 hypothetical protein [Salinivirgaceae bacterium]